MKKRHYIITAIVAYLVFLVATIPAKPVGKIINDNSPLTLVGVNGTLWNGTVTTITINQILLEGTTWSFSAWKLLLGKAAIQLVTHFQKNEITTEIGTSFLGTYFINHLDAKLTAEDLSQLVNIPLVKLAGNLSIDIEHGEWSQSMLPRAAGNIIWSNASLTVAETASLGNISIVLGESAKELLVANIKNQGGDIKIEGIAELIAKTDYAVNIKLLPTATASNNIKQSLGLFAKKQSGGEYLFTNTGSLKNIGLI